MAAYADLVRVRRLLLLNGADQAEDEDITAELTALNAALSATFEGKVGRRWLAPTEDPPEPETRVVALHPDYLRHVTPWAYLVPLPGPGITSLTSVTAGALWDGTEYVGGDVAPASYVAPIWPDPIGVYLGLALSWQWGWAWTSPLLVTGTWADVPVTVPDDVVDAVTFLVVEEWKAEHASPTGQSGPDGQVVPTRNPWKFERVRSAIDRYSLRERVVV